MTTVSIPALPELLLECPRAQPRLSTGLKYIEIKFRLQEFPKCSRILG